MDSNEKNLVSTLMELNNTGIQDIGASGFAFVMAISLVSSFFIAALYLSFYGSRATGSQIHRSFPLLGMSVTAIFICIQFSLPLSLGLLGALSIVRFRTPIKEPEEIGFIMLVIGSSIAVATFSLWFLVILMIFATVALLIQKVGFNLISRRTEDGMILITVSAERYQSQAEELKSLLGEQLIKPRIESVSKSNENSVISYSFRSIRSSDPVALQQQIGSLLGSDDINIYLNKQSTL